MDTEREWLDAAFSELRERERLEAPAFEELMRAPGLVRPAGPGTPVARGRSGTWRLVAATGLAAAMVGAMLLVREHASSRRFEAALARAVAEDQLGSWTAPSDFLLEVPGRGLYASLPVITTGWDEGGPAPIDSILPESRRRRP